jgi:outer membrane protein assembly factor BamB
VLVLLATGCAAMPRGGASPAARGGAVAAPTWAMEGANPGRSSRVPWNVAMNWELRRLVPLSEHSVYAPAEYATPLLIDGVAYVGYSGRAFEAIRLSDGERLWRVSTHGRIYATAAFVEGLLIFGDEDGHVYALNLGGVEAWRFSVRYPIVASPIVAQGKVYLAVADQNVFCLEAATGRPIWQHGQGFPRRNALWRSLGLAFGEGRVYAGFSDGTVVALDAEIGRVIWRAKVGTKALFGDVAGGPTYADGSVYAGAFRGPTVRLDAASGKEMWRQNVQAASGFAVGDDLVFAGTPSGTVIAMSKADGERVWEAPLDGGVPTPPVLAGAALVVGASAGSLYGFDAHSGAVLGRYTLRWGLDAQPMVFERGVLFVSNAGSLQWVD